MDNLANKLLESCRKPLNNMTIYPNMAFLAAISVNGNVGYSNPNRP